MKGVYIALVLIAIVLVILKYPQELRCFFIALFKYVKGIVGKTPDSDTEQSVSRTNSVEEVANENSEWNATNTQRDSNIEWLVSSQKQALLKLDDLQKKIDDLNNLFSIRNQKDNNMEQKMGQVIGEFQNILTDLECQKQTESDKRKPEKADRQLSNNTLYADGVDSSSPLGFLVKNLSDVFSNQFFVIECFSSNRAVFRFVDDYNMQKLLISSMYQLIGNGVCEIEGECVSIPTSIQVISDGMLQLKNGVWVITKKITLNLI